MIRSRRTIVNLVSLSRLLLALAFVVVLAPTPLRVAICALLCVVALATDVADGYLARRFGVASTHGRHWDSLGDKSFYLAVDVAFIQNHLLLAVLAWILITREVALYITRILYIQNIQMVERIRPYTNWHGYFMYGVILLGLVEIYGISRGNDYGLFVYTQMCAVGAIIFGVASIFAYIRLAPDR